MLSNKHFKFVSTLLLGRYDIVTSGKRQIHVEATLYTTSTSNHHSLFQR